MRLPGSCWTCSLLMAGHFGGVRATISNNNHKSGRSGKSDYERPSPWDRLFAQKKLGTECPADHQLCPDSVGGGCCPKTRVCGTNACLATIETAVTISHPKITEPPSGAMFKRKLGSNKWNIIHEGIQGQKRDAPQCGAGLQSCAASLSGGCCPTDRICGTDSCYAASTLPATVCGVAGYVACGMAEGGTFFLEINEREITDISQVAVVLKATPVKSMVAVHLLVFPTRRPVGSVRTFVQHQWAMGAARTTMPAESVPAM